MENNNNKQTNSNWKCMHGYRDRNVRMMWSVNLKWIFVHDQSNVLHCLNTGKYLCYRVTGFHLCLVSCANSNCYVNLLHAFKFILEKRNMRQSKSNTIAWVEGVELLPAHQVQLQVLSVALSNQINTMLYANHYVNSHYH